MAVQQRLAQEGQQQRLAVLLISAGYNALIQTLSLTQRLAEEGGCDKSAARRMCQTEHNEILKVTMVVGGWGVCFSSLM